MINTMSKWFVEYLDVEDKKVHVLSVACDSLLGAICLAIRHIDLSKKFIIGVSYEHRDEITSSDDLRDKICRTLNSMDFVIGYNSIIMQSTNVDPGKILDSDEKKG